MPGIAPIVITPPPPTPLSPPLLPQENPSTPLPSNQESKVEKVLRTPPAKIDLEEQDGLGLEKEQG